MATHAPETLRRFVREVCAALGSEVREQALVADQLVGANLAGHDSHGVGMLPAYVNGALSGALKVNGGTSTVRDSGAVVVLDGNMAFGQVNGHDAMNVAIDRATTHGLAMVGLRNSFHIGRIGHWGEQCAAAGLVSIHFVNVVGHPGIVAPHGARDAKLGTNPFCVAIPAAGDQPPLLLDMATSTIALGKARVANLSGTTVPPDTIVTPDGDLTDDPGVMFASPRGALVTAGEHKGSGLAIVCELLSAALIGGPTYTSCEHDATIINNMSTIVIDPAATDESSRLRQLVTDLTEDIRGSRPRRGVDDVLAPGDPENRARERRAAGIALDEGTLGELRAAARAAGADGTTITLLGS